MGFDSVVFADSASNAALSCFSRLSAERAAGRPALLIPLVDATGAEAIHASGLAVVQTLESAEAQGDPGASARPWRERLSVLIRRLKPVHVLAPIGLLGSTSSIDYFKTLRLTLSVDRGRDLLFYEERPHCLVPEAVLIRLSSLGVHLPPGSPLKSPRRYAPFAIRLITGWGVPPIFGRFRERARLSRGLKTVFREAREWDSHRALGPKLQPVIQPFGEDDAASLFDLARDLGQEAHLGSRKSFRRRMTRHASSASSPTAIERYWLSLPGPVEADPIAEA